MRWDASSLPRRLISPVKFHKIRKLGTHFSDSYWTEKKNPASAGNRTRTIVVVDKGTNHGGTIIVTSQSRQNSASFRAIRRVYYAMLASYFKPTSPSMSDEIIITSTELAFQHYFWYPFYVGFTCESEYI